LEHVVAEQPQIFNLIFVLMFMSGHIKTGGRNTQVYDLYLW